MFNTFWIFLLCFDKYEYCCFVYLFVCLFVLAVDLCIQWPQLVYMGYERHKNDWKNLVFTVPQYMCLGCWGKICSLVVVVVVFGDSIASICRREQICIKPAGTAWSGLFTRSESHVYTSVWVLLCLLTSWISFHVHAESYCSVNCLLSASWVFEIMLCLTGIGSL